MRLGSTRRDGFVNVETKTPQVTFLLSAVKPDISFFPRPAFGGFRDPPQSLGFFSSRLDELKDFNFHPLLSPSSTLSNAVFQRCVLEGRKLI